MAGAEELRRGRADILTIADCPIARARMDSSLLACKVRRELGMEALPHMTCRDRNLNATKGAAAGTVCRGVRNVLLVTGDPVPTAEQGRGQERLPVQLPEAGFPLSPAWESRCFRSPSISLAH